MKSLLKLTSIILCIIMLLEIGTVTAFASTKTKSKYTGITYTHDKQFDERLLINGIDISQHNGEINWKKVKDDGIKFVFIRVGYTGYTKSAFSLNYDRDYKRNLEGAIAQGLKVGVYWYSQAITVKEAEKEAEKLTGAIKDYDISFPVVMDYEMADTSAGRLDSAKLSKEKMTNIALAFLGKVEDKGYDACIYASRNFLTDRLFPEKLDEKYRIWLAHYTDNTDYPEDYEFWQYTSNGRVNGISGRVDMNFWYYDDTEQLGSYTYTGEEIKPQPTVTCQRKLLTKGVDYTLSYSENVEIGTGTVIATGIGDHKGFEKTYPFVIKPSAPKGVSITKFGDTSMTVKWNEDENADYYNIRAINKFNGNVTNYTSNEPKLKIKGLLAGCKYEISVNSVVLLDNEEYISNFSKSASAKLTGASVYSLKAEKVTTQSVKLRWSKAGSCDKYAIYAYNSSKKKYVKIAETDKKAITLKNLKSAKLYAFRVAPITDGKIGKKSSKLKVATYPKKTSLKSAKSHKKSRITLKWKKQSCSGYQIQWSTTKNFSSNYKTVDVSKSKTEKTIKTARTKYTYYVRIRAYKTNGSVRLYGNWSKTIKVKVK